MDNVLAIALSHGDLEFVKEKLKGKKNVKYQILNDVNSGESTGDVSAILLYLNVQDHAAGTIFEIIKKKFKDAPVVILSRSHSVKNAVNLMKLGAVDFLSKDETSQAELFKALDKAIAVTRTTATDKFMFLFSPIPMWIFYKQSLRFVEVNSAALDKYGYSEDEFLSMTILDIQPKEDAEALLANVGRDIAGFLHEQTWRHRKKNGEIIYVSVYAQTTIYNAREACLVAAMDINTQVLADRRNRELTWIVQQQKQQLDNILSDLKDVVWASNLETNKLIYINDASLELFGYSPSEMIADPMIFYSLIHPEDAELFQRSFQKTYSMGKSECEFRIIHRNGEIKYIKGFASLRKGVNGDEDIISGISVDITSLKKAQNDLAQKAAQIEDILESITDGFFALNSEWKFTYVNRQFEKMYRCERSNVLGALYWDMFPFVKGTKLERKLRSVAEQQKSMHFTYYSKVLDKWLYINAYPADDGLTVFFEDTTEERKRSHQIELQNEKLREIAWLFSHKVRGPVATMKGLRQLFNFHEADDPVNREVIEGMAISLDLLDEIIREIDRKTTVVMPEV